MSNWYGWATFRPPNHPKLSLHPHSVVDPSAFQILFLVRARARMHSCMTVELQIITPFWIPFYIDWFLFACALRHKETFAVFCSPR